MDSYISINPSRTSEREKRRKLRVEVASWQKAVAGLLVLSVSCNAAMMDAFMNERKKAAEAEAQLEQVENDRDYVIEQLGTAVLQVEQDRQARQEQAEAYAAIGAYQYIGACQLTAYCCEPYKHICGTGDGLTATGLPVAPGIVAVDPEVIPLGSIVVIDGQRYLAADTGGTVKGLHIDIAVETHRQAEAFGVQEADVWVEVDEIAAERTLAR